MGVSESVASGLLGQPNCTWVSLQDHIHRGLVDKAGKTFNIADEFVTHSVRAHMIAAICSHLGMSRPTDSLVHDCSREWLESTAKSFVRSKVYTPI